MPAQPTSPDVEHFATLFDHAFLAQGLCLYRSLAQHAGPFRLWVLCIDEEVENALRLLALPGLELIPLAQVETDALRDAKASRSRGEYCWTLTPFLPDFVFERDRSVQRVTYLDADLYFFDAPRILIDELDASGSHVLITDHAYAPEYAFNVPLVGRFCVQFMTFRRTEAGRDVLQWWQARCLEWCYARAEDGKFGDQKYLDDWPERFPQVHVLAQTAKTAAPWNAFHLETRSAGGLRPVFYHFQGLRMHSRGDVTLFSGYRIGPEGARLYRQYLDSLRLSVREMQALGIRVADLPREPGLRARTIRAVRLLKGTERRARLA